MRIKSDAQAGTLEFQREVLRLIIEVYPNGIDQS
jgi:hypothetical protein